MTAYLHVKIHVVVSIPTTSNTDIDKLDMEEELRELLLQQLTLEDKYTSVNTIKELDYKIEEVWFNDSPELDS